MEVDPPSAELPSPASHLLAFSTLGASEKSEPMSNLPETSARPQKDLFSQDISVKMASELLFKLSGMLIHDASALTVLRVTADPQGIQYTATQVLFPCSATMQTLGSF